MKYQCPNCKKILEIDASSLNREINGSNFTSNLNFEDILGEWEHDSGLELWHFFSENNKNYITLNFQIKTFFGIKNINVKMIVESISLNGIKTKVLENSNKFAAPNYKIDSKWFIRISLKEFEMFIGLNFKGFPEKPGFGPYRKIT